MAEKLVRKQRLKNWFDTLFRGKSKPQEHPSGPKRKKTLCDLTIRKGETHDCHICQEIRKKF